MTETEALKALQAGDREALAFFVDAYQLKALRLAFAICGDRMLAEDVVADAYLAIFQNKTKLDTTRPFEPYLLRIVVNRAISATRKRQTRQRLALILRRNDGDDMDPLSVVEANESKRELIEGIKALPTKERAAIVVRYLMDYDEKSAADLLGWPLGTLKTRLHKARVRLRASLEPSIDMANGGEATAEEV